MFVLKKENVVKKVTGEADKNKLIELGFKEFTIKKERCMKERGKKSDNSKDNNADTSDETQTNQSDNTDQGKEGASNELPK